MAEIVNLRLARKRKAREDDAQRAGENRRKFGRTGAEKRAEAAEEGKLRRHLDAHRRQDGPRE